MRGDSALSHGQESSVVERSNLEDALWKALQELAESNFLHRLRFWRGWGRELPAEIDRRLRPLEEAVSARSAPTETDCVAGHVDGVSGLVAAVSEPLGGCASD